MWEAAPAAVPSHLPSTVEEAVLALEHFVFLRFGFRGGWVVAHTSEARAVGFILVLIYSLMLGGGALNFTVLPLMRPRC